MKFSDLKIAARIYFSFGAVVALLVILVAIACLNLSKLNQASERNTHTYLVLGAVSGILEPDQY